MATFIDPIDPYKTLFPGKHRQSVSVGGRLRSFIAYVPEGARESTSGIFILPENGTTAEEAYVNSGWRELADTADSAGAKQPEKTIVFFLEPDERGEWNTDEPYDKSDGDVAYIDAVFAAASGRSLYCVHEAKNYIVGYREGGTMAHMAAMHTTAVYAGLVSVGGSAVPSGFLGAQERAIASILDGFQDPKSAIPKRTLPLPVWIIDDPLSGSLPSPRVAEYWKQADRITLAPVIEDIIDPNTKVYACSDEGRLAYPQNQDKGACRLWESRIPGASARYGASIQGLNETIWHDFLFKARRWMGDPGGDLRLTRDPILDLGMERHFEKVGGWMREWYVYVPRAVREKHSEGDVPLVIALHGYTLNGGVYAGQSGWDEVAEKAGFIVAYPSAICGEMPNSDNAPWPAWNLTRDHNRADDIAFVRHIVEHLETEYQVDRSRVYVTGHSMGSLFTQVLGLDSPGLFAAIAPCSGVLFLFYDSIVANIDRNKFQAVQLPVWMCGGTEEAWLLDTDPAIDSKSGKSIALWNDLNRIPEAIDWKMLPWQKADGRWITLRYSDKGIPLVQFTKISYFPHATLPEHSSKIWVEFFSKYSRNSDGSLRYVP